MLAVALAAGGCSGDDGAEPEDDGGGREAAGGEAPDGEAPDGWVAPAPVPAPGPVEPGPDAVAQVDLDGLLPEDRQAVWHPGLAASGGIPHRDTVCATLEPSGGDDTGLIQDALNTCPEGEVVQLGDGDFQISGDGLEMTRSHVTLRGNGPDNTRLVKEPGSEFPVIIIGKRWYKLTQTVDLAAGAPQGARSIELTSDPGLHTGELVIVDQLDDPELTQWSPGQPEGDPSRSWFVRDGRPLGQVLEVKAVNGSTVELTTPLHIAFPADRQPQLTRYSGDPDSDPIGTVRFAGIEDLHVHGGEGGDGGGNIHLFAPAYSWVRNVESEASSGGSVVLSGCFRCEVRDSYLHSTQDPNPGGGGYGLVLNDYASDNLIENNMIWNFNKVMVFRGTGGGNVVGYNYVEDGWISYDSHWPESGLNASHFTTPSHELFEGNLGWNFDGESTWGNSIYITAFRNHLTGMRRSVPPLELDSDDNGFRRVVTLQTGHWWYSFVANVLGTADQTAPNGFAYEWDGTVPDTDASQDPVWMWIFGDNAYSEEWAFDDPMAEVELVRDRTLRHGNFDFVSGDVVWDAAVDRRDLPPSLYLADKPAFFEDHPWPWVAPEQSGGDTATLPARERFDRLHGP